MGIAEIQIQIASQQVLRTIQQYGNDCTLPDGSTIRLICSQKSEEFERIVRQTIVPEQLQDLQGDLVLFKAHPSQMDLLKPGTPVIWNGKTYHIQPSRDSDFANIGVLRRIVASTGGFWLLTDSAVVFRDVSTTSVTFNQHSRATMIPVGSRQYIQAEPESVGDTVRAPNASPYLTSDVLTVKFGSTDNVDSRGLIAALTQNNLETSDYVWMNSDDIRDRNAEPLPSYKVLDGDYVINLSTETDTDGNRVPTSNWGTVNVLQGGAFLRISPVNSDSRIAQFRSAQVRQIPASILHYLIDVKANGYVPIGLSDA